MLITTDKCLHYNFNPKYLRDLLTLRSTVYSVSVTNVFSLSKPAYTSYAWSSLNILLAKLGSLDLYPST